MASSLKKRQGMVYLVGAGPGDPGLLTLRAVELLGRADVVLYDRLLHPSVLGYARADAEMIDVGKTAGYKVLPQEDIARLLAQKAKAGLCVVRLKGGDPFVFGRGGEEALALAKARVAFEIVPGVTSAIAVPAYAGIPVTFRDIASSFAVVTGHEDPAKGHSDMDWSNLAKSAGTLVFLMGTKNVGRITKNLARHGMPKDMPCAMISTGTYPDQRTLTGTLGSIARMVASSELPTPAILVVGRVVGLRDRLQWFEKRALFGKSILVTRAREQASGLGRMLEDLGAKVYQAPTIRIVPPPRYDALDAAIKAIAGFDWIFFTSVNGVNAFLGRLAGCGMETDALGHLQIAVIGPASREPLQQAGLHADLVPARFVSEGIVEEIDRRKLSMQGKKALLVRAAEVRDVLAKALSDRGAQVTEVVAYQTISEKSLSPEALRRIRSGTLHWITFTSSSTVKNFFGLLDHTVDKKLLKKIRMASIGPVTSQTLRGFRYNPAVEASVHTIGGLVDAIINKERA